MIYVMADIHGNMRRFKSILSQINLQPEDTLYILGDVIDRHPDGIRILRMIMAKPNMKMLLGNHEYMMLRALGDPYDKSDRVSIYDPSDCLYVWYRNGGGVTHRHLIRLRKQLRAEIFTYLKSLPLNIDITVNEKSIFSSMVLRSINLIPTPGNTGVLPIMRYVTDGKRMHGCLTNTP